MRAAIVGTGNIAGTHAKVLRELGHEIIAVVNPDQDQAQQFAHRWSAEKATTNLESALADNVDSVHICTPPVSHTEIIAACLEAGLHIYCEKPLTVDPAQTYHFAQLAAEKHLVNAVNFNNRFYEASQIARDTIAAADFGTPHLIHGRYFQEFHVLPAEYSWRYQSDVAGPMRAVSEIGSHWIDLVRFWTGLEFTAVSASFGNFQPARSLKEGVMGLPENTGDIHVTSEDAAIISLQFANGAIGSLLLSEVSHGRTNQLSLEVTSAANSLWWDSEQPYQLHQAQKNSGIQTRTAPFGQGFLGTFHDGIAAFYADVVHGEINPHHQYADFLDGAINAAVCAAIYESSQNAAQWVAVHLPTT